MNLVPESDPLTSVYTQMSGIETKQWFPLAKKIGLTKDQPSMPTSVTFVDSSRIQLVQRSAEKYLRDTASKHPNFPFVLVKGIGYLQVPAQLVSKLSTPGITLGWTTMAQELDETWKYFERNYGFTDRGDLSNILWVGTATEALAKLTSQTIKT